MRYPSRYPIACGPHSRLGMQWAQLATTGSGWVPGRRSVYRRQALRGAMVMVTSEPVNATVVSYGWPWSAPA